jgi:hypothetical protein
MVSALVLHVGLPKNINVVVVYIYIWWLTCILSQCVVGSCPDRMDFEEKKLYLFNIYFGTYVFYLICNVSEPSFWLILGWIDK